MVFQKFWLHCRIKLKAMNKRYYLIVVGKEDTKIVCQNKRYRECLFELFSGIRNNRFSGYVRATILECDTDRIAYDREL